MAYKDTAEYKKKHAAWALAAYYRNKEKHKARMKRYRESEGRKEARKKYDKENKKRIAELSRKRNQKYIHNIMETDPERYAVKKLQDQLGLPKEVILEHPEIIKAKCIIINIKRKIKNHGKSDNNNQKHFGLN